MFCEAPSIGYTPGMAQGTTAKRKREQAMSNQTKVTDSLKHAVLLALAAKMEITKVNKDTNRLETVRFEFGHVEGTSRFESQPVGLAGETGFWASAFSEVSAEVRLDDEVHQTVGGERYVALRACLNWQMATGGSNGTTLDYFYHVGTDKLLTREELRKLNGLSK